MKNDIQKQISGIAKEVDWIGVLHSQTLQEVTDRLFKAYDGFFEQGKGFPKLAKKGFYSSFTFKQGVKLHQNTNTVQPSGGPVPKLGKVKYRKSQTVEGRIKTAHISQQVDGWYISLVCEGAIQPLPTQTNVVGLDVGIKSLATFSDGSPPVDNPKYLYQYQKQLTKAQRSVSRKKKGADNRKKAVEKRARIHLKIRNIRKDFQIGAWIKPVSLGDIQPQQRGSPRISSSLDARECQNPLAKPLAEQQGFISSTLQKQVQKSCNGRRYGYGLLSGNYSTGSGLFQI